MVLLRVPKKEIQKGRDTIMRSSQRKSSLLGVLVLITVLILCMLGVGTGAQMASPDEYKKDSERVYTDSILDKADISLGKDDSVIRKEGKGYVALTILRAFEVEVDFCGKTFYVNCSEGTVGDAIKKVGITLSGAETVTPSLDTPLTTGTKISIAVSCGVTVVADGVSENYSVMTSTVGELLSELDITLDEDDMVTPVLDELIEEGMTVIVQRVEVKEETDTEIIDYGFVTEETSSLVSGTSKIKQYGIEGERTVVSKNTYIDGELSESVVISDEVTKEPVDQIKLIGTGKAQTSNSSSSKPSNSGASVSNSAGTFKDASGKTVSYKKKLTGTSTAYYAAEGAITATGAPVHVGGVAVNPNVIPYGSKLYIVSSDGKVVYGYATAVDTGGALMSGSVLVDVFYPTYGECMNWGRRNVTVYVLS